MAENALRPRTVPARPSREQAEEAVRTLLRRAGDDPAREGLLGTPRRVVESFAAFYAGYGIDAEEDLRRASKETEGHDGTIMLRGIRFDSHCEHHMVTILGTAHVAYLPKNRVVGSSKLARMIDAFAKRLQTQEVMTVQIAQAIGNALRPRGVAVVIDAEHQCMTTRGIHKTGVRTVTRHMLGAFRENPDVRRAFLAMI